MMPVVTINVCDRTKIILDYSIYGLLPYSDKIVEALIGLRYHLGKIGTS